MAKSTGAAKPKAATKAANADEATDLRGVEVVAAFRDKDNFDTEYTPGLDVTGVFTEERLADLVKYGLVKYVTGPGETEEAGQSDPKHSEQTGDENDPNKGEGDNV